MVLGPGLLEGPRALTRTGGVEARVAADGAAVVSRWSGSVGVAGIQHYD